MLSTAAAREAAPPDVEGPHRELRAGLADGLRGDHAHRLADVHPVAPGKVTPVAGRAHPEARLAGDGRAHLHLVDPDSFELLDPGLVQQSSPRDPDLPGRGRQHVLGHHPSEHPLGQRLHDIASLDERSEHQALRRVAIHFRHHQVLRHVHQPPGEVAGVGGLQRGVGEALARTVGGNEVLQHVQAFAEVGGDRRLDDRSVGLRHESAHAGELPDLRRRSPRARVGHHVNGVERGLRHPADILGMALEELRDLPLDPRHRRLPAVTSHRHPFDGVHLVQVAPQLPSKGGGRDLLVERRGVVFLWYTMTRDAFSVLLVHRASLEESRS